MQVLPPIFRRKERRGIRATPPLLAGMAICASLLLGLPAGAPGKIFTTRTGQTGSFDNPESLGAKEIYGGRFRINGHPAEMQILAGSASVKETLDLLRGSNEGAGSNLKHRESPGTVVGSWGEGASEKRFLITAIGSERSCMIFILKNNSGLFSQPKGQIAWPNSLPVLDPLQQPLLVVEHLDTDFIFASVLLPHLTSERALETCRNRMATDGWEIEPLTASTAAEMAESGAAILLKKGKTCWMEAQRGAGPNESMVTLLCKRP